MNLDVIGTEAELRGGWGAGGAEGDEDRWIKSKGGREREGAAEELCFQG